jgi:hypothetical protein
VIALLAAASVSLSDADQYLIRQAETAVRYKLEDPHTNFSFESVTVVKGAKGPITAVCGFASETSYIGGQRFIVFFDGPSSPPNVVFRGNPDSGGYDATWARECHRYPPR